MENLSFDCQGGKAGSGISLPQVPVTTQPTQGRRTGDLVLTWLNHELALKTGVIDRQRIRDWAAGLSEDEAERLLAGLWDWNRRVYGDWAAVA